MLIDQSKKSVFGKFSSYINGCCDEKMNCLIDARTLDTNELKPLVKERIKELNALLRKIDKLEAAQ